jgi:alkyl hydroperoxide reductase subunit AhpF
MTFLNDRVVAELKERFAALVHPVKIVTFSQALQFPESEEVKRLVEEVASVDARLAVESRNFVIDADRAKELGVARIPGLAILRAAEGEGAASETAPIDYGVRFYGLPMQYDFGVLIDAIVDVSRGESGLDAPTVQALDALPKPVHLQVFSTPT